jgi:hypothetical protein
MDGHAAFQLYELMSKELCTDNSPALRSVSIFKKFESGHYAVRVRLDTTAFGWEKSKQAILEKYGQGIDIVLVHNFRILPR